MMSGFSLYLHIPYCYHRCPYCDFNTYAVAQIPEREYAAALLAELDYWATRPEWRQRPIETIFFGGGTPSLFASAAIRKIITAVTRNFPISDQSEISLEANPGSVTIDSLMGYREAGVNRLSLGAQSFNNETLKQLGRMHTPEQTLSAMEHARSAGFTNTSLDLIYACPQQTLSDLRRDLEQAVGLEPAHISAYGLTIEKGTPFFARYKSGSLKVPDEEVTIQMMQEIAAFLPQHDYRRYEISNFARPGREAKHNMAYWEGHDYLGLGAGAHSCIHSTEKPASARRWCNYALPENYMKHTSAEGHAESWRDELDREDLIFEYFFLGLRKTKGISISAFKDKFGVSMEEIYQAPLEIMLERDMLAKEGDLLKLTDQGLLVADSVVENFVYTATRAKKARTPQGPATPLSGGGDRKLADRAANA